MQTNFIIKSKNPRIKSLGDNITSHHQLGAFLSGQDLKMVQQEGNDTNCFVSLVVDTPGNYVAIVTRKVQTKSEVTIKNLGTSYEFFGEGSKDIAKENTETTKTIDKEVIEYFDLEVERHEVHNNLSYLDKRFEDIERKKSQEMEATKKNTLPKNPNTFSIGNDKTFLESLHDKKEHTESSLWNDMPVSMELTPGDEEKLRKIALEWTPDPKLIHKAVCNIITCNLIINSEKFDLKQWVHKHMVNVYKRIFGEQLDDNSLNPFNQWKEFIIQFTLDNFSDDAPEELMDDWDLYISKVAAAIWDELRFFSHENDYIQSYQETLECYIIE